MQRPDSPQVTIIPESVNPENGNMIRAFLISAVLIFGICGPAELSAQTPGRFSITPLLGYTRTSPVFDYDVSSVQEPYHSRDLTRLHLKAATTMGLRVGLAMGQSWTLQAEAAYGGTEFEFHRLSETFWEAQYGEARSGFEFWRRDDASITTLGLAVGRRFRAVRTAEIELSLGGALQRLQLHRPDCRPQPPSLGIGGGTTCFPLFGSGTPTWEPTYNVPSLSGAAALRLPLARRLAAELRTGYQIGRADTESFHQDLTHLLHRQEAPKQTTIGTLQLSVGLNWRP
jgi:hypothetical protein